MKTEIDKFCCFIEEAGRLWERSPERVLAAEFFHLWEAVQQPRAFEFIDRQICIDGCVIELENDDHAVGFFTWDYEEMCPSLRVEGRSLRQKVLLIFQDGKLRMEETPPVFLETEEMTYGERLEIIYDVIAHTLENLPGVDVRSIRGRAYKQALQGIAAWHSPHAIRLMERLPGDFRQRLVDRAVSDMAIDELSSQLTLPLGGNYAVAPALSTQMDPDTPDVACDSGAAVTYFEGTRLTPIQSRTVLEILWECCQLLSDKETAFVLPLATAEILQSLGDDSAVLRVRGRVDMPLREGELLKVMSRKGLTQVGDLFVDIFDGDVIYGRLAWRIPGHAMPLDADLVACRQASSSYSLSRALEALASTLDRRRDDLSPCLSVALGLSAFRLALPPLESPKEFDASHRKAWRAAIHPDNPLVLVHGPPGTGKTALLERVLRHLCEQGRRVLVTAPSNAAVDNVCRRVLDLPILRLGYSRDAVAADVADACWADDPGAVRQFAERQQHTQACVFAATHVGLLHSELLRDYQAKFGGYYDAIVFDEAGMSRCEDLLLCLALASRAILFGDHRQLPPLPLPAEVYNELCRNRGVLSRGQRVMVSGSCLQWLGEERGMPMLMLQRCYRCHNPRLMRFSSTLFYDARIRASETAEYYRLPYAERVSRFPRRTLRFMSTSTLPDEIRREQVVFEGQRLGIENELEARIVLSVFLELLQRYPLNEISIIANYQRQVQLLRNAFMAHEGVLMVLSEQFSDPVAALTRYLCTRVSTVDSFQGGESDAVVVSYVRSGGALGIGFVDDPNRINVAHTRARREMVIVGDLAHLKAHARGDLFVRMERAFRRDGQIVELTLQDLETPGK